jgi:protein involved in polysaccharide export with SLBB domain
VADGIPVRRLPPEVVGHRREEERPIPLPLLRQQPPDVYRFAPGDVLGVWIEGVLGDRTQPVPVTVPEQGKGLQAPAMGYPIPVREDGTISLPLIDPLDVKGLSLAEVQARIVEAYTVTKKILQPGRERIIVSLMRPRRYSVLVVREDSGGLVVNPGTGSLGQTKRGTGAVVELPAYENDVLTALTLTGGLPGLDAANEVVIQRGSFKDFADPAAMQHYLEGTPCPGTAGGEGEGKVVRIPLRLRPGEAPPFRAEDVILRTGDIVYIEARDTEVFYTGGLLPARQFVLPRDYSLDVLQAVAFVNGPLVNGGVGLSNLSGNITAGGIGAPSPSLVTILRQTPGGGQIPIRVSLNRALRDPRERVIIQPGDVVILQETLDETLTRYFNTVFSTTFLGTLVRQNDLIGTASLSLPNGGIGGSSTSTGLSTR